MRPIRPIRLLLISPHPYDVLGAAVDAKRDGRVELKAQVNPSPAQALKLAADADVVVLDAPESGFESHLALVRTLSDGRPDIKLVVYCEEESSRALRRAQEAGACGVVAKRDGPGEMLQAVRHADRGKRYVSPLLLAAPSDELDAFPQLSPREMQVLVCLADGKSNQAIADECGIGSQTVKTHCKNLFRKLGASSAPEAVVTALRLGLIR